MESTLYMREGPGEPLKPQGSSMLRKEPASFLRAMCVSCMGCMCLVFSIVAMVGLLGLCMTSLAHVLPAPPRGVVDVPRPAHCN